MSRVVTLCEADCTRHGPTWNGGACAAEGNAAEDDGAGVDDRLPKGPDDGVPIL